MTPLSTGTPAHHLRGSIRFREIDLLVGPGVFTPQPETSSVVDWLVEALHGMNNPVVADLCTGSGTIAFSVAHEVPGAVVHAVERDADAVAWTRRNAEARAAAGNPQVSVHHADVADCLPGLDGTFDVVVSNPPYVATHEGHIPSAEVLEHDPAIALWAGEDGLDIIRLVERAAERLLRPGGLLVIEHSDRQQHTAPAVLSAAGAWVDIADHDDQLDRPRFVTARLGSRP